jgi:hypothetical protein
MLYLTSQRTKLSDAWCFEIPELNKDHCKNNGAKRANGWRDMQIYASFPMVSTYIGYRYTTCAFSPVIPYAGRLN